MVERAVLGTTVTSIRNCAVRIGLHTLSKALQSGGIEGLLIGLANEMLGGDHKALAVKRHLQGGAKFGFGMTLALRDGAGIEVIKGDQAICNVALAGSFLFGLFIQER